MLLGVAKIDGIFNLNSSKSEPEFLMRFLQIHRPRHQSHRYLLA